MATDRYVTSTGTDTYANSTNSATPMSFATAILNAAAGDRINVKADAPYSIGATQTVANTGTITSPIWFRGYLTTPGDGYQGRTGTAGTLVTTNMPAITFSSTFRLVSSAFNIWETINFTGNCAANVAGPQGDSIFKSCKILNNNATSSALAGGPATTQRSITFDCDLEVVGGTGGFCVALSGTASKVINCRIKGGTGGGITVAGSGVGNVIIGNVIYGCTQTGITLNAVGISPIIYGNTITGCGGDAIGSVTSITGLQAIMNNLITDNTGDAIDMTNSSNGAFLAYNRTRDNGSALANGGDWTTATTYGHVTTDTGGPETDYADSASNDYRLILGSPAAGAGWFPSAAIGAFQLSASRSAAFGG